MRRIVTRTVEWSEWGEILRELLLEVGVAQVNVEVVVRGIRGVAEGTLQLDDHLKKSSRFMKSPGFNLRPVPKFNDNCAHVSVYGKKLRIIV